VTGSLDIMDLITAAIRLAWGAAKVPLWKENARSRIKIAIPTVRAETKYRRI